MRLNEIRDRFIDGTPEEKEEVLWKYFEKLLDVAEAAESVVETAHPNSRGSKNHYGEYTIYEVEYDQIDNLEDAVYSIIRED